MYRSIETPAGPVSFAARENEIVEIRLGVRIESGGRRSSVERETARQLEEYFEAKRKRFTFAARLVDATPFSRRVLEVVGAIPFGTTLSYAEVAARAGNPRAARAVGNAVGGNPLPILIPCHRVLAAGKRLGGFGAGLDWKRYLLDLEGIEAEG